MGGELVLNTAERTKKGNSKKKTTGVGKKKKRQKVNKYKKIHDYIGVYGREYGKTFRVSCRRIEVGYFANEILAAQAYDVFAREAYVHLPKLNEREHPDDFKNLTEEQKLTEEQIDAIKEKFKASGLPRSTTKFNLKPEAKQSNPLKSLWESHAASKKKKNPPTQSDDEE